MTSHDGDPRWRYNAQASPRWQRVYQSAPPPAPVTDAEITRLRSDAMAVRNSPLASLCGKALRGDTEARARITGIIAAARAASREEGVTGG